MGPLSDTWTSGGVSHTVTTHRLQGESQSAWEARHAQAVDYWQTIYPPD